MHLQTNLHLERGKQVVQWGVKALETLEILTMTASDGGSSDDLNGLNKVMTAGKF